MDKMPTPITPKKEMILLEEEDFPIFSEPLGSMIRKLLQLKGPIFH
jgi:hypothetical protein